MSGGGRPFHAARHEHGNLRPVRKSRADRPAPAPRDAAADAPVHVERQLSVFHEARRGALPQVVGLLSEAGVNILAVSVPDATGPGVVRVVVDDPRKAGAALKGGKVAFSEEEVLAADLSHRPGALSRLARKLAQARVEIEYAYGSTGRAAGRATLYIKVSDTKAARKALSS